jgi:hypothetical protein
MKNEVVRTVWISHSWPLTGFYCSPGAVRETAHGCNIRRCRSGAARTLKKIKKEESDASLSLAYFILFKKHYFIPLTSVGDPDPEMEPEVV